MATDRRGGLEVAERRGGDDDAEDADDVDLERHTQRESDQPEIERHGRRDADGRALREELLDPSAGEITEQLAEEGADDETGHDDQHDEAEPTLGRRAGGDVYATISWLASVTTRVSAAIARRRCLGRPKACWWVWPSQQDSSPFTRSAMSRSTVATSCFRGSIFFPARMNPHGVPKHEMNVW